MKNVRISLFLATSVVLFASLSQAEPKKKGRTVVLDEIPISARVHRPIAAVDIARQAPKMSLPDPGPDFREKVAAAALADPF